MAGTSPRLPEQYYHQEEETQEFRVNEIAAEQAGGLSPFGPDVEFPLALDKINYTHPSASDRPNLADGH